MEVEKALEVAKRLRLKERYGVRRIGFFGSLVRNKQMETSDIDVLVEFEKGAKTFGNYMNLKFFGGGLWEEGGFSNLRRTEASDKRKGA